jgi:hypothetical protein
MSDYSVDHLWRLLESLERRENPYEHCEGRGIVIPAGGRYLPSAYLCCRMLRELGCQLPIQLWHLDEEELHINPTPFHQLDVETVNAEHRLQRKRSTSVRAGWKLKPLAVAHSDFAEVLLLDADNFPLKNPEKLFDTRAFRNSTAIFWPDFYSFGDEAWAIKPWAWDTLRLPKREQAELEAGQVLINKKKAWKAMQVTLHMNRHHGFYYDMVWGDKDTYLLAWLVTQTPYRVIPHRPDVIDHPSLKEVRTHYTFKGNPLFQHARKWTLPLDDNPETNAYRFEDACFNWLRYYEAFNLMNHLSVSR